LNRWSKYLYFWPLLWFDILLLVFFFLFIGWLRLIFRNIRLLSLLIPFIVRIAWRWTFFHSYCVTFKDSPHIFWVYFLQKWHMFDIFEHLLNDSFWLCSYFEWHQMFLEFIFSQVIIFKDKCIPMHETQSFRKNVLRV